MYNRSQIQCDSVRFIRRKCIYVVCMNMGREHFFPMYGKNPTVPLSRGGMFFRMERAESS
jgi:hypothetical protein